MIKNYAGVVKPMELLLRKDMEFVWGKDQQEAFEELKKLFKERPMLGHLNFGNQIEISVDASGEAAGGMVVQDGKIVRVFSKKFNPAQSAYNTTRREALALLWAVQRFRHLMVGTTIVWTDHQPLERIAQGSTEVQDLLLQRWMDILQEYNIEVRYKKGSDNGVADYLSRNAAMQNMVSEDDIIKYLTREVGVDDAKFSDDVAKKSRRYQVLDGKLYLKVGSSSFQVPEQKNRLEWLQMLHDELGHPTTSSMMAMLKSHWRWEGMSEDIERINASCLGCAYGGHELTEEKSNWVQSRSSWKLFDEVVMDLITKLPPTKRGMVALLIISEAISGWPEAYPLKSKTAAEVGGCLFHYFSRYMIPRRIRSDRGGEFMNEIMESMGKHYHFEHINSSSRHPQGNGQVERKNRDVMFQLEKMDEDWDLNIDNVLMGLRVRPNVRTGLSPYEVVFCQSPRLPLDVKFRSNLCELPSRIELCDKLNISRFISARSEEHRDRWKIIKRNMKAYEQSRVESQARFKKGELVMVKNKKRKKGDAKWLGPFVVISNHAKGVQIRMMDGRIMPYHDSDIKRFKFTPTQVSGEEFVEQKGPEQKAPEQEEPLEQAEAEEQN
jgi:hypothetical protein